MNYELFYEDEINEITEIVESGEASELSELVDEGVLLEHYSSQEVELTDELVTAEEVYGSPEQDELVWFHCDNVVADGIICEQYVVCVYSLEDFDVEEFYATMMMLDYYNVEYGYTLYDTGTYLESMNYEVIRESNLTVKDLCQSLENNEKVLCSLSSLALYYPKLRGIAGLSADMVVNVIGVDMTNPDNQRVIINSPSYYQGAVDIPLEDFVSAWEKGGCYAVSVRAGGKVNDIDD